MNVLFVHQNFPGQYGRLAAAIAAQNDCRVVALGDESNVRNRPRIKGVRVCAYPRPKSAHANTHHYLRHLESAVRRGQSVARACMALKKGGFIPDVICAHPGWGEALFLKDVFPDSRLHLYCEFFYHATGYDVGFDPEFPTTMDDALRVRVKNAVSLLSLNACDAGVSPTQWQRDAFPVEYRERIAIAHEGIDTRLVRPDPDARLELKTANTTLNASDEVITYVARNLEPYRGFHVLMRALPELQKRRPRAQVIIVGAESVSYSPSPPHGQTYKQRLLDEVGARLDLNRIHFLGQVSYETLIRIYQISSAHLYLTYPFVLSWSMLEAMSAGCHLIASRTAPVEEVVIDDVNGRLVNFFDTITIVSELERALDDKDVAMRERARNTVIERFDTRKVCLPRQIEMLGLNRS